MTTSAALRRSKRRVAPAVLLIGRIRWRGTCSLSNPSSSDDLQLAGPERERPGRDGQQDLALQRPSVEAAVRRPRLIAAVADDPLAVEVDERQVGGLAGRDPRRGQVEQRGAVAQPPDQELEVDD